MPDTLLNFFPENASEPELWSSSRLCLCRVDLELNIVQASPAFRNLVSSSVSGAIPTEFSSLVHPEDRYPFLDELASVAEGGAAIDKNLLRLVLSDGRVMTMEAMAEPWMEAGKCMGALVVWWEPTHNEAIVSWGPAEEPEVLDIFKAFIAGLHDPVILLNTEGRIVQVNSRLLELLGRERNRLIGKPVAVLFEKRHERIPQAMARFATHMRYGKMRDVSTQWIGKEDEFIPVTMSGSLIRSESGELIGMVVVGRDETGNTLQSDLAIKNKELERANQELKRLDMMKDEVLSLVGHELRAPLSNILGYAEFLCEWDLTEEDKKKYARIIYQESQHLRRLVNDILDLSRLESGRMKYNYAFVPINNVVRAAVDAMSSDMALKEIEAVLELDDQLEPVEMDPDKIQQVASNIVNNAVKFSEPGKKIRVWTEMVESGVRVSVQDQGPGLTPEEAEQVFKKFGQAGDIKNHSMGAGLGMPIAKAIVEEGHGGRIWFESEGPGKGATFRFVIPEKRSEPWQP